MTETIAVYLIVGIALVLSARWIYQTVAAAIEGHVQLPSQTIYLGNQNALVCNNLKKSNF